MKRWAPTGALAQLRTDAQAFRDRVGTLAPVEADSPAGEFILETERMEREAIAAADLEQRQKAERARTDPLEHTIKDRCEAAGKKRGWLVRRRQVVDGWMEATEYRDRWYVSVGTNGEPDLEVLADGVAVFAEVKTSKGRPSKAQIECIDDLRRRGFAAGIVRSAEEFVQLVQMALKARAR